MLTRLYVAACRRTIGRTLSEMAAIAERKGSWPGCVFCRLLNHIIEPGHCEREFNDMRPKPGPLTKNNIAWIEEYQAMNGLQVDGIIGTETLWALSRRNPQPPENDKGVLMFGFVAGMLGGLLIGSMVI